MTLEFALCLFTLFFLAGIGLPVAYAILVSAFVYLGVNGQGVGIAGKVLMDGLYQSFILLAVPLFIVAANIMNAGTISERLLQFCVAAVGRFRGGRVVGDRLGIIHLRCIVHVHGRGGGDVDDRDGVAAFARRRRRRTARSGGDACRSRRRVGRCRGRRVHGVVGQHVAERARAMLPREGRQLWPPR